MSEVEKLEQAIQVLEAQRAILGNEVVAAALGPLREKLAALQATVSGPAAAKEDATQRRIVTAMFADVSGFTAMSEHMDAEDVRDTMNALWQQLDAVILVQGGKIDKHMGDGVMALWGAEEAREDDPERALHAALEMQAELAAFRPALKAASGLKMRIGLNTGPVLFGSIGMRGEMTAMGDTVNLAARLEQASPPGGILISHDTYRHVRGVFDVEPQIPLELKGKAEPVQTYLVREAKPRAFRLYTRGIEGVETHMVGRDAEMARLQTIFNQALLGNELQVVTVLGEAGIGKSRLLYEFNTWADLQTVTWWWFKGRASQSMLNTPYALLRDIFAFRFEIQDSDPLSVAHQKMEAGFRAFLPGDEHAIEKAHVIGHLIGLNFADSPYLRGLLQDPRQLRQQALFYLTQFFKTAATHFAVLMMIDDLQWADTGSLDALTYLLGNLPADTPLMALTVARPVLAEHYPRWGEGLPAFSRIELRSLAKEDSRHLVDQILVKVPDLPTAVRELVVGGAEGNPFYLEELIKMLIDSRVIQTEAENWRVDLTRLATVTVPPTLTEVLQARLDGLTAPERATLQRASVMGRIFWDQALVAMSGVSEPETLAALAGLKRKELIYERRPSAFVGTREYTFKHTLLYEVTYETLLKRQRVNYHAIVGDWLDRISGDRRSEYLAQIADHFEKGSDFARAATVLSEAAERALSLSALTEARSFFQRALDLLNQPDKPIHEVIAMEIGLAETNIQLGEYAEARQHAELASTMAGEMKLDMLVAEALIHLGQIASYLGNYADARSYLVGAHYLAHKEKAQSTLGRALVTLGGIEWRLGNLGIAREYCADALEIGKAIGDNATVMMALNRLGVVSGALGEPAEEERCYQETLSLALALGNRERAAAALNNLGAQAGEQGNWQKARVYYQRALEFSRETGAQQGLALHQVNLGLANIQLGYLAEAGQLLREGTALAWRLGALPVIVSALTYFGILAHAEGYQERALQLIGLARTNPAFDSEAEREIGLYMAEWQLDPALVEAGLQAGTELNLAAVINELINL
jgi:class 3 adenylate cyclase/tetratricopeptide (TPR) repeat protein